jgi:predicted P-loop ATPase/GTPase
LPSVFVFGLISHSAGKTTVSSALARGLVNKGLNVAAFKPRSGHSLWYQHDAFLKCEEEGRLFCEDIVKLREASKCALPLEVLNPADALMSPPNLGSFLQQNALERLYLLQSNAFSHLVVERYTLCRESGTENVLCVNEEAIKSGSTVLDTNYLLNLKKNASKVISIRSLGEWNRIFRRFGSLAIRTGYQRASERFNYVVVEGFNDAVCPEPTLHHDVIIGVAPGVAIFYDAEKFYRVLEAMSRLGKDPAALRAEDVARFLTEAEILTIPPVQRECLKDYDKLSERFDNLVVTTLHDLNRLESGKSLTTL